MGTWSAGAFENDRGEEGAGMWEQAIDDGTRLDEGRGLYSRDHARPPGRRRRPALGRGCSPRGQASRVTPSGTRLYVGAEGSSPEQPIMADIVGVNRAEEGGPYMSWWAEYGGGIRTALAVTLILVISYLAVHRGWLP
jgi:hypothetical protein